MNEHKSIAEYQVISVQESRKSVYHQTTNLWGQLPNFIDE